MTLLAILYIKKNIVCRKKKKKKDVIANEGSNIVLNVPYLFQVLSSTVANMLEEQGLPSTKSLITFIRMMDKFFDCLNVSKLSNNTGKSNLNAYRSKDDSRFDVSVSFISCMFSSKRLYSY